MQTIILRMRLWRPAGSRLPGILPSCEYLGVQVQLAGDAQRDIDFPSPVPHIADVHPKWLRALWNETAYFVLDA
jgi:hypothetical protein